MTEYHVGCGAFAIYAGTLNSKNKNLWQNKTECTDEALCAVRDYLMQKCLGGLHGNKSSGGYEWTLKDGRVVKLLVAIENAEVTTMRLIDADKLQEFPIRANRCDKEHANTHFINGIESVMEYAELLPTVDAVPVVRCKECKWAGGDFVCYRGVMVQHKPEDFCSYGERRGGGEDD